MAVVFNDASMTTPQSIFWSRKETAESESLDAYIPGVNDCGNQRPIKMSQWKLREVKGKGCVSKVKDNSSGSKVKSSRSECSSVKTSPKKIDLLSDGKEESVAPSGRPCLKDLRAEDKLRVANLIKELAKIGEEKEKAVEQLHHERLTFEKQILTLLEQQELILKDRQVVQNQLEKYQISLDGSNSTAEPQQQQAAEAHLERKPPLQRPQKLTAEKDEPVHERDLYSNCTSSSETKEEVDQDPLQNRRKCHRKHERSRSSNELIMSCQSDSDSQENYIQKSPKPKSPSQNLNQTLRSAEKTGSRSRSHGKDTRLGVKGEGHQVASKSSNEKLHEEQLQKFKRNSGKLNKSLDRDYFEIRKESKPKNESFLTPPRRKIPSDIQRKLLGPLPEPIMSSTQKSSQILADMSFKSKSSVDQFYPLPLDSNDRTTPQNFIESSPFNQLSSQPKVKTDDRKPHVNFDPENQYSDNAPVHSPNLYNGQAGQQLSDPKYISYYRKLNPKQRKQELLTQRNMLLQEQNRLRHILIEQENMLKLKKDQLREQQDMQAQRLAYFEQTGEFPLADQQPQRLAHLKKNTDFPLADHFHAKNDLHFQRQDQRNITTKVYDHNKVSPVKLQPKNSDEIFPEFPGNMADLATRTDPVRFSPIKGQEDHVNPYSTAKPESDRSPLRVVSTATSPLQSSPDRRLSMAASPLTTVTMTTATSKEKTTPVKTYTDAATSYSVAMETQTDLPQLSPRALGRQGNLPLTTNRGRSDTSGRLNTSQEKKGFSVLEILEQLESESNNSKSSPRDHHSNNSSAIYPVSKGDNSGMANISATNNSISEEESLAELEESRVLEDVFFIK